MVKGRALSEFVSCPQGKGVSRGQEERPRRMRRMDWWLIPMPEQTASRSLDGKKLKPDHFA